MNLYAGTYTGEVLMLSGHPSNLEVKRRNQISEVRFKEQETSIRALYLPSGSPEVLSGGFDGELIAFNKSTLQSTKETKEPQGMINCIERISAYIVAVGHENGLIRFWDWKAWNLKKEVREHKKAVSSLAIDPNNALFFSSASNGLILWNPLTQQTVFNFKFPYDVAHILVSESLEYILLINSKEIHQIKTENNEEVACFKTKTAEMIQSALMFQNYVLLGGDKGNVDVYALGQYEHKIHFKAHKMRVKCMKTVRCDEVDYLVTVSSEGEVSVWDVLEFLKEVESIGQDYELKGLQPLCSLKLDRRVICIEVELAQAHNTQVEEHAQEETKTEGKNKVKNKNRNSEKETVKEVPVEDKHLEREKTQQSEKTQVNKLKRIEKKRLKKKQEKSKTAPQHKN